MSALKDDLRFAIWSRGQVISAWSHLFRVHANVNSTSTVRQKVMSVLKDDFRFAILGSCESELVISAWSHLFRAHANVNNRVK